MRALREDVMAAEVDLECDIIRREVTLRDIVDLRAGDVIPIQMPDSSLMTANGVPMFRVVLGRSKENLALKIVGIVDRKQAHPAE